MGNCARIDSGSEKHDVLIEDPAGSVSARSARFTSRSISTTSRNRPPPWKIRCLTASTGGTLAIALLNSPT
jgi:hypothetical protein